MANWWERALCRGLSVLFDGKEFRNEAVHLCRHHCPVLAECRAWASRVELRETTAGGEYWTAVGEVSSQVSDVIVRAHNPYCRGRAGEEEG